MSIFNWHPKERFLGFFIQVLIKPKLYIACPLVFLFMLAYPILMLSSFNGSTNQYYFSRTELCYVEDTSAANVSFTQILIQPNDGSNILNKTILVEAFAFQQRLLQDIHPSNVLSVRSAFDMWDNSLDLLRADKRPMYTVNKKLRDLPQNLLLGATRLNGYIVSARGIATVLLAPNDLAAKRNDNFSLSRNLKALKSFSNITHFYIFDELDSMNYGKQRELLRFLVVPLTVIDYFWIVAIYAALIGYFIYSMSSLRHIKSCVGISIAVVCQLTLVIAASRTITALFYKSNDDNVLWFLFYIPVIVISLTSIVNLINSTNGTTLSLLPMDDWHGQIKSPELLEDSSPQKSFIESTIASHIKSFNCLILSICAVVFLLPFSRKTTFFVVIALFCNFILTTTFFTAILTVDHRRFNLKDILFLQDNYENLDVSLDDVCSKVSLANSVSYFVHATPILGILWLSKPLIILGGYMLFLNIRFSFVRSSSSLLYKMFNGRFSNFLSFTMPYPRIIFDRNFVAQQVMQFLLSTSNDDAGSKIKNIIFTLAVEHPIFVVKDVINSTNLASSKLHNVSQLFESTMLSSYKFEGHYFFEFLVFLVLVASLTLLILQMLSHQSESEHPVYSIPKMVKSTGSSSYSLLALKNARSSKTETDLSLDCSSGVSVFQIKELAEFGHDLDITKIITSQSPFIVSIGMDHKVLIWSPLAEPMPKPKLIPLDRRFWPILSVFISNSGNNIAFFSNLGGMTCWSRSLMSFLWSHKLDNGVIPLEGFFRTRTLPAFVKRRLLRSIPDSGISSGAVAGIISNRNALSRRSSAKSVASIGTGTTSGVDSSYENPNYEHFGEDEFVFVTNDGNINIVNSDGNLRVEILEGAMTPLRSCTKLISPRVNDRLIICDANGELFVSTVVDNIWRIKKLVIQRNMSGMMTPDCQTKNNRPHFNMPCVPTLETDYTILLVPFVGIIGRTRGNRLELIDAQTGTFIRDFEIGDFKPSTLRIFHDQPTHCKFCGSASVASFSIAYTEQHSNSLVMHTFQLESKTKNSICLRVERDPREIRCLGLESVTEKKHLLLNIEDWNVTDNNMVIGIRRKLEAMESVPKGSTSMSRSSSVASAVTGTLQRRRTSGANRQKEIFHHINSFKIHELWEGWTMNINGKVVFHEIPAGLNGLLVNHIGPIRKFGAKSIVVGFGNIMKMFYLGKEELILSTDGAGSNEENSGLKYVNKRRRDRLNNRKTYVSADYTKFDVVFTGTNK
ncbi:uncharacterized protein Ecym_2743 [Eremothecium cymbalariae DBVPG|uniref:SSD domain-containing protein n=1 Tax=Eremothecium cymbalariae (strain CBS 270.75 / DBVPG 7215 / KCTC 17166 / NRRL Y-17582) TaxID=931890 RepID=G8JPY0_ERECY|nr:Hypothetical protein Ecym_2743 [Eremothecium cymbalariae DBVPG\